MQTLDQNLKEQVEKGLITSAMAMQKAVNKEMFR
jgi:twitching motility protein PilT